MNDPKNLYDPNRKTFGQISAENQAKNDINVKTIEDDIRGSREEWEREIIRMRDAEIKRTLKDPKFHNKNFYIIMHFRKHRLVNEPGVLIVARLSCPTPVYNQAVFKYYRSAGSLEYLWSIPDAPRYYWLIKNMQNIPKDMQHEARFCFLMESGELERWVIKENGNKPDGIIKDAKNKPYIVSNETKEPECLIIQP